jgi:hypothetical protein
MPSVFRIASLVLAVFAVTFGIVLPPSEAGAHPTLSVTQHFRNATAEIRGQGFTPGRDVGITLILSAEPNNTGGFLQAWTVSATPSAQGCRTRCRRPGRLFFVLNLGEVCGNYITMYAIDHASGAVSNTLRFPTCYQYTTVPVR